MKIEMYCDLGVKPLLEQAQIDEFQASPITGLRINVERMSGDEFVSLEEFAEVAEAYREADIGVSPVFWPPRDFNAAYIDRVWDFYWRATGTYPVYDNEQNWVGATDGEDMALLTLLPEGRITTHTGHELVRKPEDALAMRCSAAIEVQALSTNKYPIGHAFGPVNRQRLAHNLGLRCNGKAPGITLPLWSQTWEGHVPEEVMTTEFEQCQRQGTTDVSFWSYKHYKRIGYAKRFVLEVLPGLLEAA